MAPKSHASKVNRGVSADLSQTAKPVDSDVSDESDEENLEEEAEGSNPVSEGNPQHSRKRKKNKSSYEETIMKLLIQKLAEIMVG